MGIERYRQDLAVQVNSKEVREVFERLKSEHKIFGRYPDKESLRDLLRPENKRYKDKDRIMAILINELRKSNTIYPLINLMFWDSLHKLFNQRRKSVADQGELFSMIQWNFYHCLMNHDVKRLKRKIDINIFLNTRKRVVAWMKDNLHHKDKAEELVELFNEDLSYMDFDKINIYPEEIEAYLLDLFYCGVISKNQYSLLIETLVYKRMKMVVWAKKRGLPYSTVKSMKYRAEVAIRRYEEKK